MEVSIRSFRDNQNMVVDEVDIKDSLFQKALLLRNEDGSLELHAHTRSGETIKHDLEPTEQMHQGVIKADGDTDWMHDDLCDVLYMLGFAPEPTHAEVYYGDQSNERNNNEIEGRTTNDSECDDLLGGRQNHRRTETSGPETVDPDRSTFEEFENRPLGVNALFQTLVRRQLLDYFLTAEIPESGVNKQELAEKSGVAPNSVRRHIDILVDFGVVRETTAEDAYITRYAPGDPEVIRAIAELNERVTEHYTSS